MLIVLVLFLISSAVDAVNFNDSDISYSQALRDIKVCVVSTENTASEVVNNLNLLQRRVFGVQWELRGQKDVLRGL